MRKLIKIVAVALLSTTLADVVMASSELNDPFQTIDESFLALGGTRSATKPAMGSTIYSTFDEAIAVYKMAKVSKDFSSAKSVLNEIAMMHVKGRSIQDLLAKEAKADWTTADVRAAKAKAVDKVSASVRATSEQEAAAMEIYNGLIRAAENGLLAAFERLSDDERLNFDDASETFKDPVNARKLLNVLVNSVQYLRQLQIENATLRMHLSGAARVGKPTCPPEYRESTPESVVTSGGSSGSATAHPSVT